MSAGARWLTWREVLPALAAAVLFLAALYGLLRPLSRDAAAEVIAPGGGRAFRHREGRGGLRRMKARRGLERAAADEDMIPAEWMRRTLWKALDAARKRRERRGTK